MGCDIHAYVEYSKDGKYWRNLTDNAGSRNYRMFSIMAGVRGDEHKLFDPKGMPEGDLSWAVDRANWLSIAPEKHPEWKDLDGWTSRDNAERWVASGSSQPQYRDGTTSLRNASRNIARFPHRDGASQQSGWPSTLPCKPSKRTAKNPASSSGSTTNRAAARRLNRSTIQRETDTPRKQPPPLLIQREGK